MKIAVISDTHNKTAFLELVISHVKALGVSHLIHCGDLTLSQTLLPCRGLRVYLAYGNGDYDRVGINKMLTELNPQNSFGTVQDFMLDGQSFFVAHGDESKCIHMALESGAYQWVLQGHTHRFRDEKLGQTRWINPGALGGLKIEERSFVILDTSKKSVERIKVEGL